MPFRIIVFSGRKGERAPRENPPNGHFFVFSHGDLSPRHTKVRHFSGFAFSPPVCRIFAWRGERSPLENTKKSHVTGFRVATFRHARRKYATFISGEFSPSICCVFAWRGERSPRENTPRLKCRDFVFHFRIFAFSHGGSPGENTKKVTFRVFDLSPSGAHAHMVGFKYTLCVAKTIRLRKTRPTIITMWISFLMHVPFNVFNIFLFFIPISAYGKTPLIYYLGQ